LQATQKKISEGCPSNQVSAAAMTKNTWRNEEINSRQFVSSVFLKCVQTDGAYVEIRH